MCTREKGEARAHGGRLHANTKLAHSTKHVNAAYTKVLGFYVLFAMTFSAFFYNLALIFTVLSALVIITVQPSQPALACARPEVKPPKGDVHNVSLVTHLYFLVVRMRGEKGPPPFHEHAHHEEKYGWLARLG